MNPMRILTTVLSMCLLVLVAGGLPTHAFTPIRDPFVSAPIGPYTLLNNPASVMETHYFTLRGSLSQGHYGGLSSQLLAYMEPDTGVGAGAFYWHGAHLDTGNKRRELGYTVARNVNDSLLYGVTVKHVREDEIGVWGVDVGLMSTDHSRLRGGFVVHNLVGQSAINPTHVTGALSYDLSSAIGLSTSLSSPVLGDWTVTELGVALDVTFIPRTKLRFGPITNVTSRVGYWFGALEVDLDTFAMDANVAFAGSDRRVTIGASYRF